MRIWQRSAMASTRAPTHSNASSATSRPRDELPRPGADPGVELRDPLPCLLAAVEALPVHPDRADQLVARVDRHQEALDVPLRSGTLAGTVPAAAVPAVAVPAAAGRADTVSAVTVPASAGRAAAVPAVTSPAAATV